MKTIILGSAGALLLSTAACAQVPVTDGANTAINDKIKALTSQIQSDTTIIKDNTTRTLQAISDMYVRDKSVPTSALTNTQAENQAPFVVIDSLLSEEAVLGFEYGAEGPLAKRAENAPVADDLADIALHLHLHMLADRAAAAKTWAESRVVTRT